MYEDNKKGNQSWCCGMWLLGAESYQESSSGFRLLVKGDL